MEERGNCEDAAILSEGVLSRLGFQVNYENKNLHHRGID